MSVKNKKAKYEQPLPFMGTVSKPLREERNNPLHDKVEQPNLEAGFTKIKIVEGLTKRDDINNIVWSEFTIYSDKDSVNRNDNAIKRITLSSINFKLMTNMPYNVFNDANEVIGKIIAYHVIKDEKKNNLKVKLAIKTKKPLGKPNVELDFDFRMRNDLEIKDDSSDMSEFWSIKLIAK